MRQINNCDFNSLISSLSSVKREKEKYKQKLDKLTSTQDYLDWYFKSVKSNPYMIDKACEILNIDPDFILRVDAILIGEKLINIYKIKIIGQIHSLEKAIDIIKKEQIFKHK